MCDLEKRRSATITVLRKKYNYHGNAPELFYAAKILAMDDVLSEDAAAFRGDELNSNSLQRTVTSRIAKILFSENEKKGGTLYKFLNRHDIYALISRMRADNVSWEAISLYLTRYHNKDLRLAADNASGKLSRSHLSRTWKQVVADRNKIRSIEQAGD